MGEVTEGGTWYTADELRKLARDAARTEGGRLVGWRLFLGRDGQVAHQAIVLRHGDGQPVHHNTDI